MTEDELRSAFHEHQDAVYRFLWRMAGPEAAEDLAQDAFLALLRTPKRFDPARGTLRTFLLAIARNLALKRWRDEHQWVERGEMRILHQALRVIGLFLAYFGICATAIAQSPWIELGRTSRRIDGGALSRGNHAFYWETRLEPMVPVVGDLVGRAAGDDDARTGVIHRILLDRERRVYFGYDVRIDALPEKKYRLSFQALAMTPALAERLLGSNGAGWTMIPAPVFPPPRTIGHGEVLEVPLLANDAWSQRLVDYVTIQDPPRSEGFGALSLAPREFAHAPGAARDFRAEDGELRLDRPRVSVNGKLVASALENLAEETGPVVWLYVPNRGRFLLSLVPNAEFGFRRAGEIRGSSLTFTVGRETFSVATADRIAPGQAAFNLYVLHQAGWKPNYPNANLDTIHIGAAGGAEVLVAER